MVNLELSQQPDAHVRCGCASDDRWMCYALLANLRGPGGEVIRDRLPIAKAGGPCSCMCHETCWPEKEVMADDSLTFAAVPRCDCERRYAQCDLATCPHNLEGPEFGIGTLLAGSVLWLATESLLWLAANIVPVGAGLIVAAALYFGARAIVG